MKTILASAALFAVSATLAFADPVYGNWKTTKDDNGNYGVIKVAPCGSKICGTLIKSFDAKGTPLQTENNGKRLIWDMVNTGPGTYGKGKAFAPDRGKTYSGKLKLRGNKLTVQGCILGVCRDGGTWSRM